MAMPCRNDAPLGVPGSTKASILNSASGATTLIRIVITAGSAVPNALAVPSARWAATPLANCTPMPSTITISTGVNAAAWNQRSDFQNQERVNSETRPAAASGPVAVSTSRDAARAR